MKNKKYTVSKWKQPINIRNNFTLNWVTCNQFETWINSSSFFGFMVVTLPLMLRGSSQVLQNGVIYTATESSPWSRTIYPSIPGCNTRWLFVVRIHQRHCLAQQRQWLARFVSQDSRRSSGCNCGEVKKHLEKDGIYVGRWITVHLLSLLMFHEKPLQHVLIKNRVLQFLYRPFIFRHSAYKYAFKALLFTRNYRKTNCCLIEHVWNIMFQHFSKIVDCIKNAYYEKYLS
jgi:hypothetical protein